MCKLTNTEQKLHLFAGVMLSLLISLASVLVMAETAAADKAKTPETTSDEIQIEADYMKFDIETSSSVYKGNVSIIQGSIKLTGDNVVITRKNDEIDNIKIDGSPARYLQDEDTENKVHATSQHMEYFEKTKQLILTIDASLEQSDQTVASQRIVYDTLNKIILAGKESGTTQDDGLEQSSGRVSITLTPKKDAASNTDGTGE